MTAKKPAKKTVKKAAKKITKKAPKKPVKKPKIIKASRSAKTLIRNAVKACKKRKMKIVSGEWGVAMDEDLGYFVPDTSYMEICPLGALLVYKNGSIKFDEFRGRRPLDMVDADETAAFILGVDKDWVECFITGFDNSIPQVGVVGVWDTDSERFELTDDPQILEYRRAFYMGKNLAKELKIY